jgi:hypothetical protein
MLKGVSETLNPRTQHPIHLDPVMAALYKNLERIDSVSKLVKTLTPSDFSPTEDEDWDRMGQVLRSAVGNLRLIAGQLETRALIKMRRQA